MSEQTKEFNLKRPKNREQALQYIEKLCEFYDIQLEEDALLDVIHTMDQKHQEQLQVMWLQVAGAAMDATGKEFLTIDRTALLDRKPFDVRASEHGTKTKFRLVKEKASE